MLGISHQSFLHRLVWYWCSEPMRTPGIWSAVMRLDGLRFWSRIHSGSAASLEGDLNLTSMLGVARGTAITRQ